MLRKALVASFIATPSSNKAGSVQMKSTENRSGYSGVRGWVLTKCWVFRRLSNEADKEQAKQKDESPPVEKVKCLMLTDDPDGENKDDDTKGEEDKVYEAVTKYNPQIIIFRQ